MERFDDLCIILKNYPYQERDRIAVCLTERHGKITALAKGAVHSRRYGGALDLFACSKVQFTQKPHAEMARIDGAVTHHEFRQLHSDFERLTAASFVAEFCIRIFEPRTPSRELFVLVSNTLFQIDAGTPLRLVINSFLCKAFKSLGYPPSLLRCVQCNLGAHEILEQYAGQTFGDRGLYFWSSESGGMVCWSCSGQRHKLPITSDTLLYFQRLSTATFKELTDAESNRPTDLDSDAQLYRLLGDFLHHHLPGMPASGFQSWKLLNEALLS